MAFKDRLNGIAYTCRNRRYQTNIGRNGSHPHGAGQAMGSVFPHWLVNHNGYSLWLEHVFEPTTGAEWFWLMWYDPNGDPTIPLSGVFDAADIQEMVGRLASFIQVP
jgi:hypothetical protein